jgi:hypothetical protein
MSVISIGGDDVISIRFGCNGSYGDRFLTDIEV